MKISAPKDSCAAHPLPKSNDRLSPSIAPNPKTLILEIRLDHFTQTVLRLTNS